VTYGHRNSSKQRNNRKKNPKFFSSLLFFGSNNNQTQDTTAYKTNSMTSNKVQPGGSEWWRQYTQQKIQLGSDVYRNHFPNRILAIEQFLATRFCIDKSSEIQKTLKEHIRGVAKANLFIVELGNEVQEFLAVAVDDFRCLETYIKLNVPPCSDGNNFGVDVQNSVIEHVVGAKSTTVSQFNSISDHLWQRGQAHTKLIKGTVKDVSKQSQKDTTSSTPTSEKVEEKIHEILTEQTENEDILHYILAADVKQYFHLRSLLQDLLLRYIHIYDVFGKNLERIVQPRGKGGDHLERMYSL